MALGDYHVNGPAIVDVQFQQSGSPGPLVQLGINAEGITWRRTYFSRSIPTDERGPDGMVPGDIQDFGSIATIPLNLSRWDDATLRLLKERRQQSEGVDALTTYGGLLINGQFTFLLRLESSARPGSPLEAPWTFPCCIIDQDATRSQGIVAGREVLVVTGLPHLPVGNGTLFTRN